MLRHGVVLYSYLLVLGARATETGKAMQCRLSHLSHCVPIVPILT